MNNECECSKVNNGNRICAHFEFTEENDLTEEEVKNVKKQWSKVSFGEMTEVYKCMVCGQLWGVSPAGHGWMSYRRLPSDYNYK
jgi:hypothetical protein